MSFSPDWVSHQCGFCAGLGLLGVGFAMEDCPVEGGFRTSNEGRWLGFSSEQREGEGREREYRILWKKMKGN